MLKEKSVRDNHGIIEQKVVFFVTMNNTWNLSYLNMLTLYDTFTIQISRKGKVSWSAIASLNSVVRIITNF